MRPIRSLVIVLIAAACVLPARSILRAASAQTPAARQLRIIAFGAHPDDAELKFAGTAALFAAQGHKVKLVALTNGDVGHFSQAGGPLAQRRKAEVEACHAKLGVATDVLDIHDGELMPDLETRKKVANLIRDWQADIVLSHRPVGLPPGSSRRRQAGRRRRRRRRRAVLRAVYAADQGQSDLSVLLGPLQTSRIRSIRFSPSGSTRSPRRSGTASRRCRRSSAMRTPGRRATAATCRPTKRDGRPICSTS